MADLGEKVGLGGGGLFRLVPCLRELLLHFFPSARMPTAFSRTSASPSGRPSSHAATAAATAARAPTAIQRDRPTAANTVSTMTPGRTARHPRSLLLPIVLANSPAHTRPAAASSAKI